MKGGEIRMIKTLWTFIECLYPFPLGRDIKPKGDGAKADVIFAQSLGFRRKNSKIIPGLSNEIMGKELVWEQYLKSDLPMILQFEVADTLPEKLKDLRVIRKHREEGRYLDSKEVAEQTVEIMEKYDWNTIILYAHTWHMWRKIRIFRKVGIKVIIPPDLKLIPFDKKSEQWWTRNWLLWTVREIPIRLYSLSKGWI